MRHAVPLVFVVLSCTLRFVLSLCPCMGTSYLHAKKIELSPFCLWKSSHLFLNSVLLRHSPGTVRAIVSLRAVVVVLAVFSSNHFVVCSIDSSFFLFFFFFFQYKTCIYKQISRLLLWYQRVLHLFFNKTKQDLACVALACPCLHELNIQMHAHARAHTLGGITVASSFVLGK